MKLIDMEVWQCSINLAVDVYTSTMSLPKHELFGLCAQMRRAALSIPSNVAEGEGRGITRDRIRFYRIARGSLYELKTQIIISQRLGYMRDEQSGRLLATADSVGRLIHGVLRSLERRTPANRQSPRANRPRVKEHPA
jgi:four helix bundle protein